MSKTSRNVFGFQRRTLVVSFANEINDIITDYKNDGRITKTPTETSKKCMNFLTKILYQEFYYTKIQHVKSKMQMVIVKRYQ